MGQRWTDQYKSEDIVEDKVGPVFLDEMERLREPERVLLAIDLRR
jgi:hypothetical protein